MLNKILICKAAGLSLFLLSAVIGWAADENITDAQLLQAKQNTIRVTRMAAELGSISKAEALEFENKINAMNAQQFKAYLQSEMASAQNQRDVSGGQLDEKQVQDLLKKYQNLVTPSAK